MRSQYMREKEVERDLSKGVGEDWHLRPTRHDIKYSLSVPKVTVMSAAQGEP